MRAYDHAALDRAAQTTEAKLYELADLARIVVVAAERVCGRVDND